jgi:hypothetical protein
MMIKEVTLALALTIAAPLAMSTAASAEESMRHDGGAMHKDGKMAGHHRGDARHHGMMHAKDRDAHDREEAKVTSELNRHELGDNRETRDH